MPFEPAWYRAAKAERAVCDCSQRRQQCDTPEACRQAEDSDFGAFYPLVSLWTWIIKAWLLIFAIALFCWLVMP